MIYAAAPSGSGCKVLNKRFVRHFHMICLPQTSEGPLEHIFKSIIGGFLNEGFLNEGFKSELRLLNSSIVKASLNVYNQISIELRLTLAKSHYTFNLSDISKICLGV